MGSNIKDQREVARLTVRGREFSVERIVWTNHPGLSFDVTDVATGQCLTAESYDDQPGPDDIETLLDQLKDGLENGTLHHFFDYDKAELAEVLGVTAPEGKVIWTCPCGRVFREGEEDQVVDHVRDLECDKVDGAGHPAE